MNGGLDGGERKLMATEETVYRDCGEQDHLGRRKRKLCFAADRKYA
jgi:hypothetical protein